MKKLFKEFKEFISRGNVLDLAVGMIIGAAFTAIINSIVNYVLKPLISLIPVGSDGTFKTVLREEVIELNADGIEVVTQAEVAILWSEVISAIISFLATALVLFIIIKAINSAKRAAEKAKAELEAKKAKEEPEPEPEPEPDPVPPAPTQEELLAEILAELKKRNE